MGVVRALLVFIGYVNADRTSSGYSFEYSTLDDTRIAFFSLGDNTGLSWFAAIEFFPDKIFIQLQAGGTTVDDDSYAGAMRLPEGGDFKLMTESIDPHAPKIHYRNEQAKKRGHTCGYGLLNFIYSMLFDNHHRFSNKICRV